MGVINDLIRHNDHTGLEIGTDTAHGRHRNDSVDPLLAQHPKIGAIVHQMRRDGVAITVPRHKNHLMLIQRAE